MSYYFIEDLNKFKTTDELADYLLTHNYKGNHRGQSCPIANYLTHKFGDTVRVGITKAIFPNNNTSRLPYIVTEFIIRFDAGMYPELEA